MRAREPGSTDETKSAESQGFRSRQTREETFAPPQDPAAGLISQAGGISSPGTHALLLSRAKASQSSLAARHLLQLQRQYGNRYVQQVVSLAKHSDASDARMAETVPEHHETLDGSKAQHFSEQLGADFSNVRIHTGDSVAEDHGAAAITFGSDIHFADGMVDAGGDTLLGHELVHTVQQGAVPTRNGVPAETATTAAAEAEANRLGAAAAQGQPGRVRLAAPAGRQFKPRRQTGAATGSDKGDHPLAVVNALKGAAPRGVTAARPGATIGVSPARRPTTAAARLGVAAGIPPGRPPAPAAIRPPTAAAARPDIAAGIPPARPSVPAVVRPGAAPPDIPATAPSADMGRAIVAEGAQLAAQIRQTVATTVASIRNRAQEQAARLRTDQATNAAALAGHLTGGQAAVTSHEQSTVAQIQGSQQAAQAAVSSAGQVSTAQVEQVGQQERQHASQVGDQAGADFDAAATAEASRFRQGSDARAAQAQAPAGGGGDSADAQAEASERIGKQAAQNFDQDASNVEGATQRAAGEFLGYLQQGVSSFVGAIDQALPQLTSGITSLVEATHSGFGETGANASGSMSAFAEQVNQNLVEGIAAAQGDLASGTEATVATLQTGAERYAAEVEARGTECADAIERQAYAIGTAIVGMAAEQAQQVAAEARAQFRDATAQASTQLGVIDANVTGSIMQHVTAASGEMAQATDEAGTQVQAVTAQAGQKLTEARTQVSQQLEVGAQTVSQQVQQTSGDAAAELGRQGTNFGSNVQQGTGQAQQQLAATINQAATDQEANLGTFQGCKSSAVSEISTQYGSLKSEADSRSQSERNENASEGQAFLEWILPASWTRAIKQWFADTFGKWFGGFLYGIISALVGILIIVGIAALAGFIAGPIGVAVVIGGALLLGAIGGIYSRFKMFEAYNGRGPGFWEGVALVTLGILDITGVPQIIEGLIGYRAFSNGHKMEDFEAGEAVGSGLVQLIAIIFLVRGAKGGPRPPEVRPPEVRPPEVRPPEARPPEAKPPEVKPPERPPEPPGPRPAPRPYNATGRTDAELLLDRDPTPQAGETPAEAAERARLAELEIEARQQRSIFERLGEQPRRVNVPYEDPLNAGRIPRAHTIDNHGPNIQLEMPRDAAGNRLPVPTGVKSIEGRIFGDTGWARPENNSFRWRNFNVLNETVNQYIRANWEQIRLDLATRGQHSNNFNAPGGAVGEGFFDPNIGRLGPRPPEAVFMETSLVRITIGLIPGPPPDFYIVTTFPNALGAPPRP